MKQKDIKLIMTPSKELPMKTVKTISDCMKMYFPHHCNGYNFELDANESCGYDGVEYFITKDSEAKNRTILPSDVEICFIPYRNGKPIGVYFVRYGVFTKEIISLKAEKIFDSTVKYTIYL